MPRRARIDAPGALHHIVIRGIERKAIFEDNTDRKDFIETLSSLLQETVTPCYSWALMTNHVHLLLCTGSVPITSAVMRRLLTANAVRFNPAFSGDTAGKDIFFRIATNLFFVRRIGISSSWSHTYGIRLACDERTLGSSEFFEATLKNATPVRSMSAESRYHRPVSICPRTLPLHAVILASKRRSWPVRLYVLRSHVLAP
jgi:REP element-mobilizing transposase RayT